MLKMQERTKFHTLEALEEIQRRSDVEVQDSSDITDNEYDSELINLDPVYE